MTNVCRRSSGAAFRFLIALRRARAPPRSPICQPSRGLTASRCCTPRRCETELNRIGKIAATPFFPRGRSTMCAFSSSHLSTNAGSSRLRPCQSSRASPPHLGGSVWRRSISIRPSACGAADHLRPAAARPRRWSRRCVVRTSQPSRPETSIRGLAMKGRLRSCVARSLTRRACAPDATFRGPLGVRAALDHVFVRALGGAVTVRRLPDRFGSDHYPVLARLRF